MFVFVLSSNGSFVQHGPARSSEAQAKHVAGLLSRRLGWTTAFGAVAPKAPKPMPKGLPSVDLAGLSPVWKDATLAAKWNAAKGRGRATVAAPVAPVAKKARVRKAKAVDVVTESAPEQQTV